MQAYIQSILYISIFVVLIELIFPNSNLNKFVTVIVSLIIIITIISPICNLNIETAIKDVISDLDKLNNFINKSDINIYEYSLQNMLYSFKENVEQTMLNSISLAIEGMANVDKVNVVLDNKSQIQEIIIYISNVKLDTVQNITNILDEIISEYNVPKELVTIIKR